MFDYCHEDLETSLMLAHEEFELLAFRGDDIGRRESWAFHVKDGCKAKSILQVLEEEGMADYLVELHELDINNAPCSEGQLKKVSGALVFSECLTIIRMINVKWELV